MKHCGDILADSDMVLEFLRKETALLLFFLTIHYCPKKYLFLPEKYKFSHLKYKQCVIK